MMQNGLWGSKVTCYDAIFIFDTPTYCGMMNFIYNYIIISQ
jgi:hypothetical protein